MSAILRDFETRLQDHFSRLSVEKRKENFPVFALEHCLDAREVGRLGNELGRSLRSLQGLTPSFQLCWLVHAAEVGYGFDGTEYWQRFTEATPNWHYEHRNDFLGFFRAFARQFGGVQPQGHWASHYRYISWPVAHALLPHDLQLQLAQSIYNARHRLPEIAQLDPLRTGEFIDRYTFERTSRYRFFLEQRELVGWIVHALMQADSAHAPILYPPTLKRILERLNGAAHAREWLKDARRQYARSTFHLPWSARHTTAPPPIGDPGNGPRNVSGPMPALLTPMLSMRFDGDDRAQMFVELPSFQQLLNLHGEFRSHFDRANVRIPCHGNALMPAVTLLSGSGRVRPMQRWPEPEEVLAEFSPKLQAFDRLVSSECRLRKSGIWLFKRGPQGTASEILGQTLRPGERYVAVVRDKHRLGGLPGKPLELKCTGVAALAFEVPVVVPNALAKTYSDVGLPLHRTIRVEPIGVLPRAWGGESLGEWLSTETPCFTLERDHDFDSYQIRCNEGPAELFHCGADGEVIISLQNLEEGSHTIDIATRSSASGLGVHIPPCACATFDLHVRRPSHWVPGELCSPGLIVETHPRLPTLLEFLGDAIELTALGSTNQQVTCSLVLQDAAGSTTSTLTICKQALPLTLDQWCSGVRGLLGRPSDEHEFLAAASAYILVDADDLGHRRIPLQNTPGPVRWAVNKTKDAAMLRLIDDGADHALEITWADFCAPMSPVAISRDAAQLIDVNQQSGLFFARAGDHAEAVIVSPRGSGSGLKWLGVTFERDAFRDQDLLKVFACRSLWRNARACSPISRIHQRQVATRLHRHSLEIVAGRRWCAGEEHLVSSPSTQQWHALESQVDASQSYGFSLAHNWRLATDHEDESLQRVATSVAKSFQTFMSYETMTLAWRFTDDQVELSEPEQQAVLDVDHRKFSTLVRAARLLRLYREHRGPFKA